MRPRPRQAFNRAVPTALCLFAVAFVTAIVCAASAHAADYTMLLCAGGNGSNGFASATNTTSSQNPAGIFSVENHCGPASDPAGEGAFLRITENQPNGNAGVDAYANVSWNVPPWVAILTAGAYTREPVSFNDGWRGRFWGEDFGGGGHHILMQGTGITPHEFYAPASSGFTPHPWPFAGYGYYRRLVFELTCMRPAGCDRSGQNAVDANTLLLTLSDAEDAKVTLTDGSPLMRGTWVRGAQAATWKAFDQGSGLRWERLGVDGAQRYAIDHRSKCDLGSTPASGEFARVFQPCPTGGPFSRSYSLDTGSLADGAHTISVCAADYAQAVSSAPESCAQRTVQTDNSAPGQPANLQIKSANPQRYLSHFGAQWSLPADAGSPIVKVHYDIVDAAGKVVVPEKVTAAANPTSLADIEGPAAPGAYSLRVWLEDQVGFLGPAASVPIPRDTTPPAAPQSLQVAAPETARSAEGFDLRWRNVLDGGSPVDTVHYQELNSAGGVAVETQTIEGENLQAIQSLQTPREGGAYTLRVWLEDAEGNVGVPSSAPLSYQCVRSDVSGGTELTSALGEAGAAEEIVRQGSGSTLRGRLSGAGGGIGGAPVCAFSRVITHHTSEFLGVALTGSDGSYQFALPAGASREVTALYRSGAREVASHATLQTIVHPTFDVYRKVVYNKHFAQFTGTIPGPDNNQVVVVLQVKRGKGWLTFHRYRTREGGQLTVGYRFTRTDVPTKYLMRAQVRAQGGYPYLQGNSDRLTLIVLPRAARHRRP